MSLWDRVVEANRPGPPEHSLTFRGASVAAVVVAAGACYHEGELSPAVTVFTIVATAVGNVASYRRRERPWRATKPILAICAVAGFVWFITTATKTATPGDISTVEGPLAVLFAWVLSTHAFDVPARRDVAYTLAGSAALIAVAAAQAVDLGFGLWVLAWMVCALACLVAMWQSMSTARGVPWPAVAGAVAVAAVLTVLLISVLPPPQPSTALLFPSAGDGQQVTSPSQLTDGNASLPARAATARGRTGVGGYLGFAKALDLADRDTLGNQIVLRVRASRPGYWIGETYDHWDGQNWTQSGDPANGSGVVKLESGSPFAIPAAADQTALDAAGTPDVQTFYLAQSGPNLVFHTDQAERVYIQSKGLYLTGDGTIVSSVAMGAGTIYTVVSSDTTATSAELRTSTVPGPPGSVPIASLTPKESRRYLQLPHPYPQVAALARRITAGVTSSTDGDPRTYDKVAAIEEWMSSHVRYTTDIPPLPAGADAVTSFLFGSRRGYCEQISTATVVMLRTLGIAARATVGYVPGSYDPFTDLYEVKASDAHSWVQVWFPGYGWQNFDPTAQVPLANPSPGSVLTGSAVHLLGRLPWVPIGLSLAVVSAVVLLVGRRRRRPPTWAHRVAVDLGRGGRHRGSPRRRTETLTDYGGRLGTLAPAWADGLAEVCGMVERYSYGGLEPPADEIGAALSFARRFARRGRLPRSAGPHSPPAGPGCTRPLRRGRQPRLRRTKRRPREAVGKP
jgi:protein-glutamine gamma-glutamyltransferase